MTSTITITHEDGVVMGSDQLITYPVDPNRQVFAHIVRDKIYQTERNNVGLSFWGLGDYAETDGFHFLEEFDRNMLSKDDFVDEIASKLKEKLETLGIKRRCGFHIAGYSKSNRPKLRHIFHENWHDKGKFIDEDCHKEFHDSLGNTISYRHPRDFPVLFNGDNFIANALFNFGKLDSDRPYIRIIPRKLTFQQCIEVAALIINTSINRLDYYFDMRKFEKIDPDVGGDVSILLLTRSKPRMIPIKYKSIHEILQEHLAK
ncbi:MAG: hypothetical protein ACFFDT_11840 [Candidatus Hodarchaeota archaeon]